MATTKNNRVGRTRKRLALMLEQALKEKGFNVRIDPAELNSQYPYWASSQGGACSWYGYGLHESQELKGLTANFCSWETMGECVRKGLVAVSGECGEPPFGFEVHAK